jgi:hypothetical protein
VKKITVFSVKFSENSANIFMFFTFYLKDHIRQAILGLPTSSFSRDQGLPSSFSRDPNLPASFPRDPSLSTAPFSRDPDQEPEFSQRGPADGCGKVKGEKVRRTSQIDDVYKLEDKASVQSHVCKAI